MNKLNVFTKLKYAWQRVVRGYDDRDVACYSQRFVERNMRLLTALADESKEGPQRDGIDGVWRYNINLMLHHLSRLNDDRWADPDIDLHAFCELLQAHLFELHL